MELLLFGQSWFRLLEFTQIFPIYGNIFNILNWQNLIWLMDFTQVFPINLNVFVFTQAWLKLFSFAQIYLKLLDLTQMLLFYSSVSNFTQNVIKVF